MFVPQARIKLGHSRPVWCSGPRKRNLPQRKLKWYEFTRMPFLVPNLIGSILGFTILCSGAVLCYIGYNPEVAFKETEPDVSVPGNSSQFNWTTHSSIKETIPHYSPLKSLAYVGPVLMGIGFFVLIVAVVLFCEIKDKFVHKVIPKRDITTTKKSDIYDMVIEEFRKNYFRGIEVPIKPKDNVKTSLPTLYKALSVSTPAILITPEVQRKWIKDNCSKVTPKHKRRRFLSDHETWLKTSSMPNIRPKSQLNRVQRRLSRYSKLFIDKKDLQESQNQNNDETECNINKTVFERRHSRSERRKSLSEIDNAESSYSNPAFRGSPTETIELSDITTEIPNECWEEKHPVDVVVQMFPDEVDSRGITEQRCRNLIGKHVHSNLTERRKSDECGQTSACSGIPRLVGPHIVITDCMDVENESLPLHPMDSNACKIRHNSVDMSRPKLGPYRTCIGVFRSESCLHRIRSIVNKTEHGDGDNSSLDSLTLNEETMKYFE